MFWGMLEMGVAMVALCLPTLRPLFHDWSLESIMNSLLSVLSLSSRSSRNKNYHSFSDNQRGRGDSEASLANAKYSVYAARSNQHQVYAMGPLTGQQEGSGPKPSGEVWVNRNLTQTVEAV